MESYLLVVILLVVLAVVDLIVGVSNDAVNFLNSAIGSRVARRNTILIIAGAGVLLGAVSSSGMMEIARKGIFNPGFFSFSEVMVVFVAVIVADILLLDFFNTLGLPTSTTVSIVFSLLGAALAVAIMRSIDQDTGWSGVAEAINHGQALAIISGIFLSIGVAFAIGAIVQYLSRLLFSFRYDKYMNTYGVAFAAVAITVIFQFLLVKGAKGSNLLTPAVSEFINRHGLSLLGGVFVLSLVVVALLRKTTGLHPLKLVVFVGTFALAMAFAGNDLVNFIGVPLAGVQSYQIWHGTGVEPGSFAMDQLGGAVETPFYYLILAGLIMVATLWVSGKARKVTQTEVNLSRQEAGEERFNPNALSRTIVGGALGLGVWLSKFLPRVTIRRINLRFNQRKVEIGDDMPAFDLIRASVNLIVASFLISWATSLKLPLSTTYVSFMVAMGTSLADRAWGRESAVYRVSGVLNVIGGWFSTALMAMLTAGIIATCIYYGGVWLSFVFGLLALASFAISNLRFNRKERERALLEAQEFKPEKQEKLFEVMRDDICRLLDIESKILQYAFDYFADKDNKPVKKIKKQWKALSEDCRKLNAIVYKYVLKKSTYSLDFGPVLLLSLDHVNDLETNLENLVELVTEHKLNHQELPSSRHFKALAEIREEYFVYAGLVCEKMQKDSQNRDIIYAAKKDFQERIQQELNNIMLESSHKKISYKQAVTVTQFLLLLKNLVAISARIIQVYHERDTNGTAARLTI